MKDETNLWLSQQARLPGVLACGVRYPDHSTFTQQWAQGYNPDGLEKALAGLADVWRTLRLNNLDGQWLRWSYPHCWFYCAQRPDGALLGLITAHDETSQVREDVAALIQAFFERVEAIPAVAPAATDASRAG